MSRMIRMISRIVPMPTYMPPPFLARGFSTRREEEKNPAWAGQPGVDRLGGARFL
ncbi:MAG: hypothetical protein ICV71_07300 [Thermoleophilia bacterium]|nr:hypothetical protein [Thermoleophilia bacterium]